jgi:hypothetical protein
MPQALQSERRLHPVAGGARDADEALTRPLPLLFLTRPAPFAVPSTAFPRFATSTLLAALVGCGETNLVPEDAHVRRGSLVLEAEEVEKSGRKAEIARSLVFGVPRGDLARRLHKLARDLACSLARKETSRTRPCYPVPSSRVKFLCGSTT